MNPTFRDWQMFNLQFWKKQIFFEINCCGIVLDLGTDIFITNAAKVEI